MDRIVNFAIKNIQFATWPFQGFFRSVLIEMDMVHVHNKIKLPHSLLVAYSHIFLN